MSTITSEEVNFLVYRYLLESGFDHSAFTLGCESLVASTGISNADVPPGALISYLQKGLQYVEIEQHMNPDGTEIDCDAPFSLIRPHICQLQADQPITIDDSTAFPKESIKQLKKHQSEVFTCQWAKGNILASGSSDHTAVMWDCNKENISDNAVVLEHPVSEDPQARGCSTLRWNNAGDRLATGCSDGITRIWMKDGSLVTECKRHNGPIFSVKWSANDKYILTASNDHTVAVWDSQSGELVQKFTNHNDPALEVDWRPNHEDEFVSCSRKIFVSRLGQEEPLYCFDKHQDEVNVVSWSPNGGMLASCGDDKSIKIWGVTNGCDESGLIFNFIGHRDVVYDMSWAPEGKRLATASADGSIKVWNLDGGVCSHTFLTNRKSNSNNTTSNDNPVPIFAVNFSNSGRYVAGGTQDGFMLVFDTEENKLVRSLNCEGGVFEVRWSDDDKSLAAVCSNAIVFVAECDFVE
eukprot:TRINITY_DN775831_c0_g1_i1.p1 TRINITY_DN775831_c0_g1~~TRINITY_DN775831_c0_g1_i1.p1  ORF type:complete len:466 (+),score=137.01 TRINITY_DN775831_c0_g1_i1:81-1478(+)